jgi:23S rRNA-intervening sequence protein
MAQYSHLPLYVKTYESVKLVYRIVKQFRKEYKYSLGAELQTIIWQVLDEVIRTNSLSDAEKKEGIAGVSRLFDRFKIRFRFAYEMGLVTADKFAVAQREFEEIGKMIGGWQKWAGR